jgi:AraC family transcriptional regulator
VRVAYRHIRPLTVVYARGTGCYRDASTEAWRRLGGWLAQHQARRKVKRGLGIFRDNPHVTPPELLRYDACVEVAAGLDADEAAGIGRQILCGGTYAVHTHVGGYEAMGGLMSRLHREWVPKQGLAVDYDRPFVAVYLNDPLLTREVHRRTDLCIPVIPLAMEAPDEASAGGEGAGPLMRFAGAVK